MLPILPWSSVTKKWTLLSPDVRRNRLPMLRCAQNVSPRFHTRPSMDRPPSERGNPSPHHSMCRYRRMSHKIGIASPVSSETTVAVPVILSSSISSSAFVWFIWRDLEMSVTNHNTIPVSPKARAHVHLSCFNEEPVHIAERDWQQPIHSQCCAVTVSDQVPQRPRRGSRVLCY